MVAACRPEWLGHLARIPEHRTCQKCLFGWLLQACPWGGLRRTWRDVLRADLKDMQVPEAEWHESARTSRMACRATYREALAEAATSQPLCRAPLSTSCGMTAISDCK